MNAAKQRPRIASDPISACNAKRSRTTGQMQKLT
jgi:hypothetical protein